MKIAGAMIWLAALASLATAAEARTDRSGAERASDKADKIICKRFIETGSLVKGYRSCKTKAEWERERDNIRASAVTSGSCSSADNGYCGGVNASKIF